MKRILLILAYIGFVLTVQAANGFNADENVAWAKKSGWEFEWPDTDFSKANLNIRHIRSGGVPKDAISSLDAPKFMLVADEKDVAETEPVISVFSNGKARAYPLRYLMFHEIVNDIFEGQPIAVTFCPLCNTSVVFERVLNGKPVEFGTTGKLHNSDLVMYDRLTETWWQQYNGTGMVGELTGDVLKVVPSRLESLHLYKQRFPNGEIMQKPTLNRNYGYNPYVAYDSSRRPFLYDGTYEGSIPALARVVVIGDVGYSLAYLSDIKTLEVDGLRISWQAGQNSALDRNVISRGKDVGNIVVQRQLDGEWQDTVYMISFAFAYKAFNPDKDIITE